MPRRYEKEIEEIIERDDRRVRHAERVRSMSRWIRVSRPRLALNSVNLMMAGITLIIGGLIWKSLFVLLGPVGALLFVAGCIMYFTRPRQQSFQKRWRGEVVDFPVSRSTQFRNFFRKKR